MPRCLQDVFDVLHKRLKNVHSTSSRRLHSIFKTSCKDVLKTSSRRFQDVFKTHDNVKLFLLIRLQDVFKTYSTRLWHELWRWLSTGRFASDTPLRDLWSGHKLSKSKLFGYTETFGIFFLIECLWSQEKCLSECLWSECFLK